MQAPYWSQGLNRYSYVFNNPVNNTDPTGFVTGNDAAAMYAPFHVPAMTTMGALGSGLGFATGPLSIGTTLLGGGAGFAQAGGTMNVAARQAAVGSGTGQGGTHATAQNTPVEPLKMPDMTPPEHLQGPDNRLACRADCYWETRGYGPQLPAEAQAAVEAGRNAGTGTVTGEVAAGGLGGWVAKRLWNVFQVIRGARTAARATAAQASGRSAGAMARPVTVLQTGGTTVHSGTARGLNEYFGLSLHRREWGRALEALKKEFLLPNKHHGSILSNGDYLDTTGKVIDNLLGYIP